jgi:hypothetical protein
MPYFRCPICALVAHATDEEAAISCPRCRALSRESRLLPLEESLRQVAGPHEQEPRPAA